MRCNTLWRKNCLEKGGEDWLFTTQDSMYIVTISNNQIEKTMTKSSFLCMLGFKCMRYESLVLVSLQISIIRAYEEQSFSEFLLLMMFFLNALRRKKKIATYLSSLTEHNLLFKNISKTHCVIGGSGPLLFWHNDIIGWHSAMALT